MYKCLAGVSSVVLQEHLGVSTELLVKTLHALVRLAAGWEEMKKPTVLTKKLLLTRSIAAGKSSLSPTASCTLPGFLAWCLYSSSQAHPGCVLFPLIALFK